MTTCHDTWFSVFSSYLFVGGGEVLFLRWWPPSTMWTGPLIFVSATTRDVRVISSFLIWGYKLHGMHISRVVINCGHHQWVIPSPFSIAVWDLLEKKNTRKLISLYLDMFFKIVLLRVFFLILGAFQLFLLTFVYLVCSCSMWLYFRQETSYVISMLCKMMTPSNRSFFRVTGPCGEFTSHRQIPLSMEQLCGLRCFFDVGPHKLLNKQ